MFYLFILFKDKGLLNRRVLQNKQFYRFQITDFNKNISFFFFMKLQKTKISLKINRTVLQK